MAPRFTIRPAGPADAETLAKVGAETFRQTFAHLYDPKDLATFLAKSHSPGAYRQLFEDGGAAWLAETEAGEAAGYAVAGPCTLPVDDMPDSAGELGRLYVDEPHQGHGLGIDMLEIALSWLEERYDQLYLSVFSENLGAQKLYARYGFRKIKEYDYMVGDHADHEFLYQRF
ncbi:GNAT family N-acetyltransferase [Parvularcula sp. ZS-1/3]|uniref:GNAT family N-acetyltransferase n=1 Tax=Parvularcula mediterranea TaxID=2732508 RepID=A0A7Y3RKN6_9PROT|nr:GNAT family N-acetyltransferase [Parvularcula mediterranea]NNU15760.1 GNAT family N-acetyltransferase [Parvularcula mediterranea]